TKIQQKPRSVTQIEVTFKNDKNDIVNVAAKDQGTGKEQKITIESSSNLSDEDIERMVKEAEENAEADKSRREEVDLRNEAEQVAFTTDKTIEDLGDKVEAEEKEKAEGAKEEVDKALEGNDLDEIKCQKDELQETVKKKDERPKEEIKNELEGTELEEIKSKKHALQEIVQGMSMKLYEQMAQEQQAAEGQEAGSQSDDDVVDADFKEVDEDDKK